MSRVRQRAGARLDLVEAMAHLAERSPAAARRFRREAQATFDRLAAMPGMGARYAAGDPAHSDLRYFPVSKFRNHLVFYRPSPDGIEVVRVLHGARDIGAILADEFGVVGDEEP